MARRTLLITASILLAALGTALIWLYVQGAENRAQQNAQLVPALFLTRDVKAGESPVGAVQQQQLPAAAGGGAVTSVSQLGSLKLTVDAVAGQVLLKRMLGTSATDTGRFPVGGAAAVAINDPNRVPRDLRVGDSVDVVELAKDRAGVIKGLSNVTVRTIGSAAAGAAGTTAPGANGTAQNGTAQNSTAQNSTAQNSTIPATIVGLDLSQTQAIALYTVVARGEQVALYLHGKTSP